MKYPKPLAIALLVAGFAAAVQAQQSASQNPQDDKQAFRFRTGVELINVTATVTDGSGRFVSGLRKEDFRVFEDDELQTISHFSSERVPVSLGIVLDTSGSMEGKRCWPPSARSIVSSSNCSAPTTKCSSTGSTAIRNSCTGGRPIGRRSAGTRHVATARRYGDLRRGGGGDPARADRQASQEGAGSDF